jgi:hypothetical protein
VQAAAHGAFHFMRDVARAAQAAQKTAGSVQHRFRHADGGSLELWTNWMSAV